MVGTALQSLETAFEHHRSGDLPQTAAACRELLRVDPRHADALHLLGIVAFQRNESVAAVDYIGQAIDTDRNRPEFHNSLGNVFRSLGRPMDAIASFREALRLKPDFAAAYNNLGIVLALCVQNRGAIACFQQAVRLDPGNAQAWTNLGSSLLDAGNETDAADCFERALAADPNNGPAHAHLAHCRVESGRVDEAIVAYERAIQLMGESVPLLKELAASYLRTGRSSEAEGIYRRAIAQSSNDPILLLNLAQAIKDQGKGQESIDWYRRGIALDPNNSAAHYALARALHQTENYAEAIDSYRKCLSLGAKNAKAAHHLGNACKSIKRLNEAVAAFLQALEWDRDFIPPLYQLGNAYRQLNDLDSARRCFEQVLDRKPGDLDALVTLGNVLKELDDLAGASGAYQQVTRHFPNEPLWDLWLATLCPVVFHSTVGIDQYRSKLLKNLNALAERRIPVSPEDITDRGCPPPYALQFHGRDDRPIKEAYARVFRNCRVGDPPRPRDGKPRVGFVVTDGHEGVFLRYLGSVLERINRESFEPVIICSAGGELRIRAEMPAGGLEMFVIPSRFDEIVSRVREGGFSVLYHWEIGSDVTNYFLPFFRLAPIQCTGAGLPVTSGIPDVDYFLTQGFCEPKQGDRAYTEKLIRSRSLLTWQRRMRAPQVPRPRSEFGIGENDHFYVCPHKVPKFHPDFDALLAEILRRDPRGVIVIPNDPHGHIARKLQNRLRMTLRRTFDRIRFVPHQTLDGYLGLLRAADVVLDPIHYGGGLTSLDGLSLGKPIVTLPGEFLRGRFTLGFYRAMGVEDCVATSPENYAELAVKLGADREWREHVTARIRDASEILFESNEAVLEYEQIFERLVDESRRKS